MILILINQKIFYIIDQGYHTIVQYTFTFNKGLYVTANTTAQDYVQGIHFNPDGTKMYTLYGLNSTKVFQYNLNEPWNPDSGTAVNFKFANTVVSESMTNFWFKPDGTKFYALGARINEWNMSESWNVASASLGSNVTININGAGTIGKTASQGVWTWNPDGTKFYVLDVSASVNGNYGKLQEYRLSTPWDITTTSWGANGPNVNFFSTRNTPITQSYSTNMFWHPNGKTLYVFFDRPYSNFSKFNFSESWNVLTFTSWSNNYASIRNEIALGSGTTDLSGFYVRPDGKIFYMTAQRPSSIKKYRFSGYEFPDSDYLQI